MTSLSEHGGLHEYYKDKTILITGSTGFLGIILLEKLIRSFPEIKQVFIIVRGKRGKSSDERMKNFYDQEIFVHVRKECPWSLSKVVVLKGDVTMDNCGLQSEDIERIHNEVDLVVHSAATVKMDELLKISININVLGTLNILNLSKGIRNLQSFIYISTMYVNSHNTVTEEMIYPHSIAPEKLIQLADGLNDETIKSISPGIIGSWLNSYTFTKNAAENLVYSYRNHMPVVIFRPSVITGPYKEPTPGWINKMYMGVYGWLTVTGLGLSRIMYVIHPDSNTNIVPCDYVAHAIIAIMWDTGIQRRKTGGAVINYSSAGNPLSWNELNGKLMENINTAPFADCVWYPMSIMEPSLFRYRIHRLFRQRLPAYLTDFFSMLVNKEPTSIKFEKKLSSYFQETGKLLKHYKFPTDNIYTIWNKLSEEDKRELNFNVRDISWDEYCKEMHIGIKKYLLKEPMTKESIRKANARYFWLNILDKVIKGGVLFIVMYLSLCFYLD